ncbi:MAG: hypothetical protein AB7H66_01230 [Hyphomonadaceae bacterium]
MTSANPIITQARVEAYFASAWRLLGWLLGAILRGGWRGRGVRLKRLLSRAELAVECTLFLQAVARFGPPPRRPRRHAFTPNGFRRVCGDRRLFFKGANIRARKAGPLARVFALIEALAHPERAVAYFLKRICNGLRMTNLAPTGPAADAIAAALSPRLAFADSS